MTPGVNPGWWHRWMIGHDRSLLIAARSMGSGVEAAREVLALVGTVRICVPQFSDDYRRLRGTWLSTHSSNAVPCQPRWLRSSAKFFSSREPRFSRPTEEVTLAPSWRSVASTTKPTSTEVGGAASRASTRPTLPVALRTSYAAMV